MRLPSPRFLVGLVAVLAVLVGGAFVVNRLTRPAAAGSESLTLNCVGGSEKSELMADAQVRAILADRYGLTVRFTPLGSYDQVRLSTDELRQRAVDCLWPSSASAQNVFETTHASQFPDYRAENVLQSPEVIYAGPRGTDALVKAKLVEKRADRYYLVDVKSLLVDHVLGKSTWQSLGAADLRGPVTIGSTDPAKSNSGLTMAQLQLTILSTSDAFAAPSLAQARRALPAMRALYDAQGLQARTSDNGFREWLTQGGEFKAPLYAGYENQLIQQAALAGDDRSALLRDIRILYPEPTIYSDHPILALDAGAGRFIDAMKDPEIQALAWQTYGFRSAVQVGLADVGDFPDLPLADQVRVTPPPNADVTLALLACLQDATKCA
ncbi:hypothetical protein [Asanoa iriomotensis]|uniref:Extracellular solute-binding protein n=1 Tax=Asanoa iriomotensis TaxID=234613 RepID=A0ABQ4CBC1_9ACTN|nr:hypothetical protein [Asanoa iriomotensis]GIF60072.1 hypothetical protein Air01nite_61670 [Asanoa iriomotensis]